MICEHDKKILDGMADRLKEITGEGPTHTFIDTDKTLQFSSCGCRFENEYSNSVILCDECSELPCHAGKNMQAGDHVEFMSDKQTEKGPSAGVIRISMGDQILIEHSDTKEEFHISELDIVRKTTHHKGGVLWILE